MTETNCAEKARSYHHGNLRDALIVAAAEIIEETGSTDFAMIDAARRAGVSSAAPYRHFPDKDALLDAVCQVAFLALSDSATVEAAGQPRGSEARITTLAKGYARFVIEHPDYYALMWGQTGFRAMEASDIDLRTSGFYVMAESVQDWCDATGTGGQDPIDLATKLWAMAHGLAGLALTGHLQKFLPEVEIYSLVESSTRTFLEGLENKA